MRLINIVLLFLLLVIIGWPLGGSSSEIQKEEEESNLLFKGYPSAVPFTVIPPRKKIKDCARCHAGMDPNSTIRILNDAPHLDVINHGKGRIWCLSCHDGKERTQLITMHGERVNFSESYLVCGGCHANRQKDWYFGAHGKRQGNWEGKRIILSCSICHDPHEPAIKSRKPQAPPAVRIGLPQTKQQGQTINFWPWRIAESTESSHE